MNPRTLTPAEIDALHQQGCSCSAWNEVRVSDPFQANRFRNVHFSGTVQLGIFTENCTRPGGIEVPC